MADFKYEIVEELGVLSENSKGWRKELNLISWNGAAPKYDIRDWSPEHEKMGKGVVLPTGGEPKRCDYCDAVSHCSQARMYGK